MGIPTPFDNQVLLIARLFLASFLGQYFDIFLSMLGPTCSVAALEKKIQRSVTRNSRFPVIRGQANGTSCVNISGRKKELFSQAKSTPFWLANINLCQLRFLILGRCSLNVKVCKIIFKTS